jgi:hypothetical protein
MYSATSLHCTECLMPHAHCCPHKLFLFSLSLALSLFGDEGAFACLIAFKVYNDLIITTTSYVQRLQSLSLSLLYRVEMADN